MRECPVCGESHDGPPDIFVAGGSWDRCRRCGLQHTTDAAPEIWRQQYMIDGGAIPPGTEWTADDKTARAESGDLQAWYNMVDDACRCLPPRANRGLLLEIGCGPGDAMEYAARGRWAEVVGTEMNRDYVLFCRSRGLDVRYTDMTLGPPPDIAGRCDLVIANQVMEHIDHDRLHAFVRGVKACLAPDGLFWATYPVMVDGYVMQGEWWYWTVASAALLLQMCGLEVRRLNTTKFSHNIAAGHA